VSASRAFERKLMYGFKLLGTAASPFFGGLRVRDVTLPPAADIAAGAYHDPEGFPLPNVGNQEQPDGSDTFG